MKIIKIFIFILTLSKVLLNPILARENNSPVAVKGVLDLSHYNFVKNGSLTVKGEWLFHWKKFLDPNSNLDLKKGQKVKFPGFWNELELGNKKLGPLGYGSFLLRVKGAPKNSVLGLSIKSFSSSFKIFIIENGKVKEIGGKGVVGKLKINSIPQIGPSVRDISTEKGDFTILIHGSNYYYRGGGLIGGMVLGLKEEVRNSFEQKELQKFFTLGVFLIMALYHFGLFYQRRQDKGSLWFSIFCFIVVFRFLSNDSYIDAIFSSPRVLSFYINRKIEFITFYLGAPVFCEFLKYLFKDFINDKLKNIIWGVSGLFSLIVLFTPPLIFTKTLPIYQVIVLFNFAFVLTQMIRASLKNIIYSRICLTGILIFLFGTIWDILIAQQIIPPPEIAAYTIVVFVFIQSYILSKKFSYAYETAERLTKDLEKEVLKRIKEAVEARNEAVLSESKVSTLLHNMRQSIFTVNSKGTIIGPVSDFSNLIFEEEIEGKSIFNVLYKDMDKKSELYSTLNFSFTTVFDGDDLQWEMMSDHFPARLKYVTNEGQIEKVLFSTVTPLFDNKNLLSRIMFVVEDRTEIEKLEKEVEEQKENSLKNIHRLQELAKNKKEDLSKFFSSASKMIDDVLILAKMIRNKNDRNVKHELENILRVLHTLKGNARLFNLTQISSLTHEIESIIIEQIQKTKNNTLDWDISNLIVQLLYTLQGEMNSYLKSAKEVFALEFEDDIRFKDKIHDLAKNLEYWLTQLHWDKEDIEGGYFPNEEDINVIFKSMRANLNNGSSQNIEEEIFHILHSLKGLARGMDERILSSQVHLIESGMNYLKSDKDYEFETFNDEFIKPLNKSRKEIIKIVVDSDMFNPFEVNNEKWGRAFAENFKLIPMIEKKVDNNTLVQYIYGGCTLYQDAGFEYLPSLFKLLYAFLEKEGLFSEKVMDFFWEKTWRFISFVCLLDNNEKLNNLQRKQLFDDLVEKKSLINIRENLPSTIFLELLHDLELGGISYKEFFEKLRKVFDCSFERTIISFISIEDIKSSINEIVFLYERFLDSNFLKNFEKNKTEGQKKTFKNMEGVFEAKDFTWLNYSKNFDILKILKTFSSIDDQKEVDIRPNVKEVLFENFVHCKEEIKKLLNNGGSTSSVDFILDKAFDLPVKYSFHKFNGLVNEVSKNLGKKVRLKLSGIQGSLEKQKLDSLLEAMVHLIRNSLDHGIEKPEQRLSLGKDEVGEIEISCQKGHDNELVIIIRDDGRGIDTNKIVEKTRISGLVTESEILEMSEEDKLQLIFLTSLSTKEVVSEISGRGVGMDVVQRVLNDAGASIEIKNSFGKGLQFTIIFPYSLAV